ncbi:hypothetical protein [Saccharibacillus sp. JS10]|uniref:hypothetical protein n=1 Tax=Saccharibacillus sp. JS10 TaxID=2950552 RepID=UPI00210E232C|nr:hypothetical protein [Saccharibacillus sp. JS10]MCQ4087869.1 hypothetical protein [Saccharibacillus sp. JS10]
MMLVILAILLLLIAIACAKWVRLPAVPTADGAAVMAFAIFTQGVFVHFAGKGSEWIKIFTVITLLLGLFMLSAYLRSIFDGSFKSQHWDDPIGRFAIGTWVAGIGAAVTTAHLNFPELHPFLVALGMLNVGLLLFYLFSVSLAAGEIAGLGRFKKLHGIILLTTVALQSVCLMLHELFGATEYMMYRVLILLGILFYIAGTTLLILRYRRYAWDLADDWQESNGILYGAVAITGAAALKSSVFPNFVLLGIWTLALLLLLIIEGMEVKRAVVRIRRYGYAKGLGVYTPSQWSRLFTLGMFYFFSREAGKLFGKDTPRFFSVLHEWIVFGGAWILIFLFIAHLLVWAVHFLSHLSTGKKHSS